MTPWSTEVAAIRTTESTNGRVRAVDHVIRVSLMLTTDPGPLREFRPFFDFDLDEAHATELLGRLTLALRELRDASSTNHHVRDDSE